MPEGLSAVVAAVSLDLLAALYFSNKLSTYKRIRIIVVNVHNTINWDFDSSNQNVLLQIDN